MSSDDVLDGDTDWSEYNSGPFCQHFSEPSDCDMVCKCGHKCCEHFGGFCNVEGCECEEFEDAPE